MIKLFLTPYTFEVGFPISSDTDRLCNGDSRVAPSEALQLPTRYSVHTGQHWLVARSVRSTFLALVESQESKPWTYLLPNHFYSLLLTGQSPFRHHHETFTICHC